ncbi:hypothetical protein FOCC_FOCC000019 [Frankliniella occidentalis]|nr:hypothetical protein FOCC_FOCC000019 [Frankliniella occidentalis]
MSAAPETQDRFLHQNYFLKLTRFRKLLEIESYQTLALLTLSGRPQVAVQVLCGGTACRTETFLDADKPVVRFVAPGPGPLVVRLHNGGVENGVVLTLQRAQDVDDPVGAGAAVARRLLADVHRAAQQCQDVIGQPLLGVVHRHEHVAGEHGRADVQRVVQDDADGQVERLGNL